MQTLTPDLIQKKLLATFPGLSPIYTWGETSFFYNPNNIRPKGTYFCTIKEHDGENDKASALNRENTFRFNCKISKKTFLRLFQIIPKRPAKGGVIQGSYDFTKIDELQPHPIYGWMCWVSIINPTESSFQILMPLLHESYKLII